MDDYITLLKYPDIEITENEQFLGYMPEELMGYKRNLENLRQQFLSQLVDIKDVGVINGYLSELREIVSNVEMKETPRDALQDIQSLGKEGDTVMQRVSQAFLAANLVDRTVVASANKTIAFIEGLFVDEGKKQEREKKETVVVKEAPKKEWLTLKEVCDEFPLSYNNVKNRQWRKNNGFPKGNDNAYETLCFSRTAVMDWLKLHKC